MKEGWRRRRSEIMSGRRDDEVLGLLSRLQARQPMATMATLYLRINHLTGSLLCVPEAWRIAANMPRAGTGPSHSLRLPSGEDFQKKKASVHIYRTAWQQFQTTNIPSPFSHVSYIFLNIF